ncbi:MAG: nitroreductase family protein [Oscillospiraceae bacterium]|nr:nitroreductase family protein [Oscillospiraceae bacterium]
MEALEAIFTRRSIRSYRDEAIADETMQLLLKAAMSGPSCVNARDWSFIVVHDREMLNKMADANGRPAEPLRSAAAAVMVCGDLNRSFPPAKDYWVIDGAIAAQNIVLAAHALGLGSVWLGTWPQKERVEAQAKLFGLPESIVPHSVIALGYPLKESAERDVFESDRVHMEKW